MIVSYVSMLGPRLVGCAVSCPWLSDARLSLTIRGDRTRASQGPVHADKEAFEQHPSWSGKQFRTESKTPPRDQATD